MATGVLYTIPGGHRGASRSMPRGASRTLRRDPLVTRLPKPNHSVLKYLGLLMLVVALIAGGYQGYKVLMPYVNQPISRINVVADLHYSSRETVQQRILPFATARFFNVDLAGLRAELEQMPWISKVEVRRLWPDQLDIRLEEQMPVARWGENDLLNNKGQTFKPKSLESYESLPQLNGPAQSRQQVMQYYLLFSEMLRPLGFSISRLEQRDRGSWFLLTSQGVELLLGRERLVEKMRRFSTIYEHSLKDKFDNIAHIDLRYPNGLAVAWKEAPTSPQARTAQKI